MLAPLRGQRATTAIARALMTNPRLLLIDEVSLGLSPQAVHTLYESIQALIHNGATIVLVEQDLQRALSVAGRVICLLEGRLVLEAPTQDVTPEHQRCRPSGTTRGRLRRWGSGPAR
jgi:branched-chain amino acid transport system ATP-binding protein